jgi:8-oxo-dGTP pyrophosphatase MutT (NUDIX family)
MDYTAGIFLFNGKHEILLVHPTNARMDTWSIPKGYVDDGETVLETAKREFFEETNVKIDDLKLVYLKEGKQVMYASKKKTLCPFFAKVLVGTKELDLKCNSKVEGKDFYENDIIQWTPIERAYTLIHDTQKQALLAINPLNGQDQI